MRPTPLGVCCLLGPAPLGAQPAELPRRVADAQLGAVSAHDSRAAGNGFAVPARPADVPTARCLILVTPDAQPPRRPLPAGIAWAPAARWLLEEM